MKETLATLLMLTLVIVCAGAVFAAEELRQVSGMVISYVAGKSITIQNDGGNYTFDISDDTKIEGNITEGLRVMVEGDGNVAFSITLMEADG